MLKVMINLFAQDIYEFVGVSFAVAFECKVGNGGWKSIAVEKD